MRAPSSCRPQRRPQPLLTGSLLAVALLACAPLARVSAQDELEEPPEVTMQRGSSAPQSAMSQKEADKRARELFEKGRVAFADGQYRDAWEHFRDAYKLSKRPALLYNVGQSADRMRMDREALEAFRLYLKKLPEAENRKEVESRVRWLEERLANEGAPAAGRPETLDDSPEPAPANDGIDAYANAEVGAGDPSRQKEDEAAAETKDEVTDPKAPDKEILPDGQPTRTGWYFRLDLGLGFLADSLKETETSLTSITASGLFAVGYTVTEGVVLGGAITGDWGLSPSASRPGGAQADLEAANFSTLSFVADYYLAPRANGWHLMGGLGLAQLGIRDTTAFVGPETAGGLALLIGGGHEWTVDRSWAIGAFARVIGALMSTDTAKHTAFIPSITCNAVWY
jgi:hypothetical protein